MRSAARPSIDRVRCAYVSAVVEPLAGESGRGSPARLLRESDVHLGRIHALADDGPAR